LNIYMNDKKLVIPISGLHCKSCEMLVEEQLNEVKGVKKAEVSYKKGAAEIYYDSEPDAGHISEAIRKAGYSVGPEPGDKRFITGNKQDYKDLGIAFIFLVGLYFVLKGLGFTGFNFTDSADGLTVPLVLLVGLTAGVSTCMALVGGLVLGIAAEHNKKHPEATPMQKFRPHLFFNLGRVLGFALLGGVLGLIGSSFQLSGSAMGVLTVIIGLVMLAMGLQIIGIFPWADNLKLVLPKSIGRALGLKNHQKEYSHRGALLAGALTFFLPCGFTQAMQVYAISSGNFWTGALIMGLFALGTVPGLLGIGGLTSVVKGIFAKRFFKLAGLAVIAFAVFNISNGFGLLGWNFSASESNISSNDPNVTIENGVQVVKMAETANGYVPNSFTIKKGVPVRWVIDGQAPYSCASTIIMPQYNIRQSLVAGENIIEFTPTAIGRISFSCSMGMYTGSFNVVGESGQADQNVAQAATTPPSGSCGASTGGGCGCGGGGAQRPVQNNTPAVSATITADTQVIKSVYTNAKFLEPAAFKVKAGVKVSLQIDVRDSGAGCGNAIKIPGLYDNAQPLQAGSLITMEFTPTTPGSYSITCGMGMIRFGSITVE
jgi:sulfite exporter TauE/SafE/copper chaperone CopZ